MAPETRQKTMRDTVPSTHNNDTAEPDKPPRFTIDLSLPPEQRYLEVCAAFQSELVNLTPLFDEVVGDMVPFIPLKWLHRIWRLFLRGVCSNEENAELKGISKATGVQMYLLVCFNVLLDLFMGCSSGGAAVRAGKDSKGGSKMVHFRTLDWGMDALRQIVVQLDFVMQKDGPIVASSITYAGYVGVLTGARPGMSVSLNFRPNRIDNGKFWPDVKYAWHLLMVLLGRRRSISTNLRMLLLPHEANTKVCMTDYADAVRQMAGDDGRSKVLTTTACYLCFCDGQETTVIEKDRISAKSRSSQDFIVVTNGDEIFPGSDHQSNEKEPKAPDDIMQAMLEDADERVRCAQDNWSNMRKTKLRRKSADDGRRALMEIEDVVNLVQRYPTTNECTHFACVMDPTEGTVSWCRRWKVPRSEEE